MSKLEAMPTSDHDPRQRRTHGVRRHYSEVRQEDGIWKLKDLD